MGKYQPELGQSCFGQPWQELDCNIDLERAITSIGNSIALLKGIDSPCGNNGERYKNDVFEIESYSWDDTTDQPYNFKYKDIEVSWYKYAGRGMTMNRKVTKKEITNLLRDCMLSLL